VELVGGFASALILFRFSWWAPILLAGAWLATHYLLRESAVWFDRQTDEVRSAQRDADYAFNLAVDPPASKELRLFGLAGQPQLFARRRIDREVERVIGVALRAADFVRLAIEPDGALAQQVMRRQPRAGQQNRRPPGKAEQDERGGEPADQFDEAAGNEVERDVE